MWAHSDKAQLTKLIFSFSFQTRIFSSVEFFCKRNVHNLHFSVHRISMEQPVMHSTHYVSLSKTYFLLSLINRFISKEGKSWEWRKALETLIFRALSRPCLCNFYHLGYNCPCSRPALPSAQLSHCESDCWEKSLRGSWAGELCPLPLVPSILPWLEPCCRHAHAHPYPWPGWLELAWLWMLSAVTVPSWGSHQAVPDLHVPASSALPQVVAG